METAIGVFSSRDHAEEAVKELREQGVPEKSIVFLTRSESEAKTIAKELGATVGGFLGGAAGMSAGVVAATLLAPGRRNRVRAGFWRSRTAGSCRSRCGRRSRKSAAQDDHGTSANAVMKKAADDVSFFREVLKEKRSLIVVRTESRQIAEFSLRNTRPPGHRHARQNACQNADQVPASSETSSSSTSAAESPWARETFCSARLCATSPQKEQRKSS